MSPPSPRGGFTLIEVLVAMIILAIALMGLQALGISAVRATALAERNTRASAIAALYLEDALSQIGVGMTPPNCDVTRPTGERVLRTVTMAAGAAQPSRVVVTITPNRPPNQPYSVTGHAYNPTINNPVTAPCP